MSYVTPVVDRTQSDIDARNSKAFLNVADWNRIYGNAQLVNSLVNIIEILNIPFPSITAPTISNIPDVDDFNALLWAIEEIRQNSQAPVSIAIKYDWEAGMGKSSPNYLNANQWESVLDAIWTFYNGAALPVCPTLSADLTITTGNQAIYVDCLDTADYNIDLQGTANLYII